VQAARERRAHLAKALLKFCLLLLVWIVGLVLFFLGHSMFLVERRTPFTQPTPNRSPKENTGPPKPNSHTTQTATPITTTLNHTNRTTSKAHLHHERALADRRQQVLPQKLARRHHGARPCSAVAAERAVQVERLFGLSF
jgi:hypothetical protein